MTARRLAAIAVIFIGASIGWSILGVSVTARSGGMDARLEKDIELLWGSPQRQVAPNAWVSRLVEETRTVETQNAVGQVVKNQVTTTEPRAIPAPLESTEATVDLTLEHRQRGLLWYPTYSVAFKGAYTFRNPDQESRELHLRLPLPADNALYDDFVFRYAFFFEGFTGLTVTIGAIITLFAMMQMTAHISWDEVCASTARASFVSAVKEPRHADSH